MAKQDVANNNWISARYWCLLLIFIAIDCAKGDESQIGEPYFAPKRQDTEGGQVKFQQDLNVSSRIFDVIPSCTSTFYERNFFFSSANYPQFYQHNSDCIFTVKRSDDVCELRLDFENFDLEDAEGCLYDYLEINGQKFCGSLYPGTQRVFPFTGSEIVIRFRTNAVTSNRGFFIRGSQLTCGQQSSGPYGGSDCDRTFDQKEFRVTSPNFPAAYDSELDCNYIVRKSDPGVCFLQFTFTTLDLRESPSGCLDNFLEMNHQRFCYLPEGSNRTVEFMGSAYFIRFRTGNGRRSARSGFSMDIHQLPCSTAHPVSPFQPTPPVLGPSCGLGLDKSGRALTTGSDDLHFHIRSPGYPFPYPTHQDCEYVVHKASADICTLRMVIEHFNVHPSPECHQDFVSVGGQRLCGILQEGSKRDFDFPDQEIHIRFQSDVGSSRGGFSLTFQQIGCFFPDAQTTPPSQQDHNCDIVYNSRSFEITSPSPDRLGPFFGTCTYTIRRLHNPDSCVVVLEFLEFDFNRVVEDEQDCGEEAFLEIDGERLCHGQVRGTIRKYSMDNDAFQIRFLSKSVVQHHRFRIRGTQHSCPIVHQDPYPSYPTAIPACNCTFQEDEFLISSGSPISPALSSFCFFRVCKSREDICGLDVVFETFDLRESSEYLDVDGQRYCGFIPSGTARRHQFPGDSLGISFYACRGVFSLRFRQVPCTPPYPTTPHYPILPGCDVTQSEPEFHWMSPNYPYPYGNNRKCRLAIQRYDLVVCQLVVTFNHFDLEQRADCQTDYLEILGERFCGHLDGGTERTFAFNVSESVVEFHSGWNYSERRGFNIAFKQKICLDGQIFKRSEIDVDHNKSFATVDSTAKV